MMGTIITEFERVTKFPMLDFMKEYREFMSVHYSPLDAYFSGRTEQIDNEHMRALDSITTKTADAVAQFKNFANKFNKCGYWELMDFIDDLNTNIEKINKLPKFRKTVLAKRGYTPNVELVSQVGGQRTIDDIADSVNAVNGGGSSWVTIMLNNDMNEQDWEIDKLSGVKVYVSNRNGIVVNSIIDMPIGKRIYGKDLHRKLHFKNNDFALIEFENNVEQKCDILLELMQGDVPESPNFGKDTALTSSNIKSYAYPEVARQVEQLFRQNDLFKEATITDVKFDENYNAMFTVRIKTKYDYQTEKTISI